MNDIVVDNGALSRFDTKQASVSDAKLAYFEGDFDRCLAICDAIAPGSGTVASEIALLRARAYLRTNRARDAQRTILDTLESHTTLDATVTADMLLGSALVRQDEIERGIHMLEAALERAATAHSSIRSELALFTAQAYWAKRDIDRALGYLKTVDPKSDIIHARALELEAWCYTIQRDYRRSADTFRATVIRLDTCRASDIAITVNALRALANFATELFDEDLYVFVQKRIGRVKWTPALADMRCEIIENQALFEEFRGNTLGAYELASDAREAAPSDIWSVSACLLSSALAQHAGEHYSAMAFAQRALERLGRVNIDSLVGEDRFTLLGFIEDCAHYNPSRAAELFASYRRLQPLKKILASSDDPRITAYEAYITACMARTTKQNKIALRHYRTAFVAFADLGCVRRAVICAQMMLDMGTLPERSQHELSTYIKAHLKHTNNYITRALGSTIDHSAAPAPAWLETHAVFAKLPPVQQEIIRLIYKGKTNKEIADLRGVQEQSIKNTITKRIFPAFGVTNRLALINALLEKQ